MLRRATLAAVSTILVIGIAVGLLFAFAGRASAPRPAKVVVTGAGVADIKVTPVRVTLPQTVGSTHVTYNVVNKAKTAQQLAVSAAEVSPATGARLASSSASADRWLRLSPTKLDLAPGQAVTVTATLDVPTKREPGERRIEVYFRTATPNKGPVTFAVALGASIWVPGPGPVRSSVAMSPVAAPSLTNPGDVRLQVVVADTGNVHRDLNALGTPVVGRSSSGGRFTFSPASVLPGQRTTLTAQWHSPVACWCELVVAVSNGKGGWVTTSTRVLVFPWAYALAALLIATGLAAFVPALRAQRRVAPAGTADGSGRFRDPAQ